MASERDIKGWVSVLKEFSENNGNEQEKVALHAIINLAATVIIDIHRIADAMEAQIEND